MKRTGPRGRRLRRLLAAAGLALAGVTAAPAGAQAPAPDLDVLEVDTATHPDMTVTVAAPRELLGRDVPAGAFTVTEDGAAPRLAARRLPSEGLEVILVVDTSGSMAGAPMAAAKAAAGGFVEAMSDGTQVAIVGFGDRATVVSPFQTDRGALRAAIAGLAARGETALYDAVATTATEFANRPAAQRVVVVLSDGGDTVSTTSLEAAVGALTGLGAELAVVALETTESDAGALDRLAGAAGGRVVPADDPAQLVDVYRGIAARLVSRYELTYTSRAEGPTDITVTIDHEGVVRSWSSRVDLPAMSPPPKVEPRSRGVVPTAGLLDGRWTLAVGAVAFALALGTAGWFLTSNREFRRRLAREYEHVTAGASGLAHLSEQASAFADRLLARHGRSGTLDAALERAGIAMRPGELVVLAASAAAAAGALGLFLAGPIVGLVLAALAVSGFRATVFLLTRQRQARFAEQLGDTLMLLAGSLRTGYGLSQAVDVVAREAPSPTGDEFRRVVIEARLGRDLSETLHALADRVGSEDFGWVVQAIDIHRAAGGDLAEIFDRVGETIRDRNRVRRQVSALSAEGRLSALILYALPFVMAFVINTTNPDYFGELTGSSAGKVLLLMAAGLLAVGGVWLRRIVRLDF